VADHPSASADPDSPEQPGEPSLWRAWFNRRMGICVFLGFTSGLPLFILLNLLQAWLKTEGLSIRDIGLFALVQVAYTWKFVWAPLMDRYAMPGLARLGRRRGWMLAMSIAVMALVATLGRFDPRVDTRMVVVLCVLVAFASASLDIVIDAFRREILPDAELGLGNAIHVNAYKLAGLVPGSLSLILADHLPWDAVFFITALFMLPGIAMVFVVDEPSAHGAPPKSLRDAVVLPFTEFIRRDGWTQALLILAFLFLYKLGDSMATALSTAFYLDIGFTKTEVGVIAKNVGLWSSVVGGLIGGAWLVRLGINRGLWIFGILQLVAIFGFAWLAKVGPDRLVLAFAIGFEAFASVGLGTAAFVAFMSRATDPRFTATQFALFSSLVSVPRTFANAGAGFIVASTGWFDFFLVCAALGVPGLLLLPRVAPWREGSKSRHTARPVPESEESR
jgi:MFS transporter, PAT family, beta-lactamase induction signal transducer AmpG